MKTGIYWFAFLSEQEQKEFRANCKDFHETMEIEEESFDFFICGSFNFQSTPQGHDYWMEICKRDVQ